MTGLRPYQKEDLLQIKDHYYKGERRLLLVWATGLGKTVAFSHLPELIPQFGRMLIIVNREELVWQAKEKIEKYNPGVKVGVEKAKYKHSQDDKIVIACIQSIGSVQQDDSGNPIYKARLQRFNTDEFGIIVLDEAHRSITPIYETVLRYFKSHKEHDNDQGKLLIGLTATPDRGDNKGLSKLFDNIVQPVRDVRWGIQNGYLCDIEAYRCTTSVDISDVKTTKGDFDNTALSNKINTSKRNEIVVDKYVEVANGKKAIAFTSSIEHSRDLAEEFNKRGIKAFALDSTTPGDIRRQVIQHDFKNGTIRVLTSVGVLCEGFDEPSTEAALMVRPTKSGLLYRQSVGRVLRPSPSPEDLAMIRSFGDEPDWIKESAIVIDFVDVCSKHPLITVPTLFGLSANLDLKGKKAVKTLNEIEEQVAKIAGAKKALVQMDKFDSLENLTAHIERVDLLSVPSTPSDVAAMSELSWVSDGHGYLLSTPEASYKVAENTLGNWSVYLNKKGVQQFITSAPDKASAIKAAESKLDDTAYQNAKNTASWKKEPPTAAQVSLLSKVDRAGVKMFKDREAYSDHVMKNFTRFAASAKISAILGARG